MSSADILRTTVKTLSTVLSNNKGHAYAAGYITSLFESTIELYVSEEKQHALMEDLMVHLNNAVNGGK